MESIKGVVGIVLSWVVLMVVPVVIWVLNREYQTQFIPEIKSAWVAKRDLPTDAKRISDLGNGYFSFESGRKSYFCKVNRVRGGTVLSIIEIK